MDDTILPRLDSALEEVRRRLRVRLRRDLHTTGGEFVGGGYHILAHLVRVGASSPSELADGLEVRTSTMTAHLDRLEAAGYVRRAPRTTGGGAGRVEVRLTKAGEAAHARYLATRQSVLRDVLSSLDRRQLAELADLLAQAVHPAAGVAKREE